MHCVALSPRVFFKQPKTKRRRILIQHKLFAITIPLALYVYIDFCIDIHFFVNTTLYIYTQNSIYALYIRDRV